MEKLDELTLSGSKVVGFIIDTQVTAISSDALPKESTINITDTNFTVKDCIIYTMNGLYALKEKYSIVVVIVFGMQYSVTLRKYAIPAPEDLMKVYNIIKNSLSRVLSREQITDMFGSVLVEIKTGEFKYEE